jgi:hypothetical protein
VAVAPAAAKAAAAPIKIPTWSSPATKVTITADKPILPIAAVATPKMATPIPML